MRCFTLPTRIEVNSHREYRRIGAANNVQTLNVQTLNVEGFHSLDHSPISHSVTLKNTDAALMSAPRRRALWPTRRVFSTRKR